MQRLASQSFMLNSRAASYFLVTGNQLRNIKRSVIIVILILDQLIEFYLTAVHLNITAVAISKFRFIIAATLASTERTFKPRLQRHNSTQLNCQLSIRRRRVGGSERRNPVEVVCGS